MENIIKDVISVSIAICAVYLISYIIGEDPNNIVGWFALGLAASASRS